MSPALKIDETVIEIGRYIILILFNHVFDIGIEKEKYGSFAAENLIKSKYLKSRTRAKEKGRKEDKSKSK